MARIVYKITFCYYGSSDVCDEVINISQSEEAYDQMCRDWQKFTSNVSIERIATLSDDVALTIANKVLQWHKEDAEEEHDNPKYEVSPMII